jgi:hypothetical protein
LVRGRPPHPEFERALWILSGTDVSAAEALRKLTPVANRIGMPRPSYSTVRRLLIAQRARRRRRREVLEPILVDLIVGRFPNPYYHFK